MSSRHVGNSAAGAAAEGRVGAVMGELAGAAATLDGEGGFKRFLVEEVIFDPVELDDARVESLRSKYGLASAAYIREMPYNTIVAKLVGQQAGGHERRHLLFPFFPQHLMLPIKAGEHVWAFFESQKAIDHGFWVCRINEPRHVDDLNHTHADRKFHVTERPRDAKDKFEKAPSEDPTFDNGPTFAANGEIVRSRIGSSDSSGDPKAYETILKETDSGKISEMESVPRFRKRPEDAVLQGSNNARIVVGTDRAGRTAVFAPDGDKGKRVSKKPPKDQSGAAGSVDMVVGAGRTPATGPKKLTNSLGKQETSKRIPDENVAEGDPDFANDAGRFYLSMKTDPDNHFEVNFSQKVEPGDPAAVIKTDHVRIIARKTVKFLVQPRADAPESECAGILIKDGNVVFLPASNGIVMLGGEDANLAVMGQPNSSNGGGTVTAETIVDTLGAQSGIGGRNGQFARKVMMK